MAKHRTVDELRELFMAALVDAEPADPLSFLTMEDVAAKAGIGASTLAYHVDGVDGLRRDAYVAVVSELETRPSVGVMIALEEQLSAGAGSDEVIAAFFKAATKQLAQDPAFPYWVGGATKTEHRVLKRECDALRDNLGYRFARPLRLALVSSGVDLLSIPDQVVVDLTRFCLLAGAIDRYLNPEPDPRPLRGVNFCAGGVMMASALPALLDP